MAVLHIESIVKKISPQTYQFLLGEFTEELTDAIALQDIIDCIYSLYLIGQLNTISSESIEFLEKKSAHLSLFGRPRLDLPPLSAHLTAYFLGAVRLLSTSHVSAPNFHGLYEGWDIRLLLDNNHLPIWPKQWSHHSWRVSHWIGGIPSILLHLSQFGRDKCISNTLVSDILLACEKHVISEKTGLIKAYGSELLQKLFRLFYGLRHNPNIADLGGIAHLLWVYHAVDRPFVANQYLHDAAVEQLMRNRPFMETLPYCLDFDIIQMVRVTLIGTKVSCGLEERLVAYRNNLIAFFKAPSSNYTIHKLPGALASLHELSMALGDERVGFLDETKAVDIIKAAYWL